MKIIKKILLLLLVAFVIAQFFGPEKNDGDLATVTPFLNETNPPDNVKQILRESCFDCHSNHSRYPWYNNITPVNYWLADHIKHGKDHFNMSEWTENSIKRKDHKFEELIEMVEKKDMPLPSYTWTHTEAKLSDEQIASIIAWAENVRVKYSLEPRPQ
ncbi:MAG: heme-binding domain-containing protein [Bacteroidia bacterium]|nr:heme-binding domain-containing protein [Bacteroidia bacterium]MBT8279428.1 heme-binding domain-containing protein [Bacteroidia bacterium]NND25090.1 heme-binding domain-containing protein [Flavobacteriaceae bacterium]NNK59356.1 heme-binding domain-containing protein [Flavobacteriaceae bacterium]RZW57819.1 MAG: cytochrome C [Flavobacteriaceae bacterium]